MRIFCFLLGLCLVTGVVLDAFQTIILPRRPKGRFRITRIFFLLTWRPWVALSELAKNRHVRDQLFSIFGPLSLLLLLAVWAALLIGGFGFLYFAFGSPFSDALNPAEHVAALLRTDLYVSGTTLFTLGLGDVTPRTELARICMVLQSGIGLGFVALVIGYVPVLYQTFSRREVLVALLDGRAGSPPTASELLRRHSHDGGQAALVTLLTEWERWSAELLESHVSYPILCYYRSQHDNQNWLTALVCVLDACALLLATTKGDAVRQAQLTFAISRHALVDLGHIFQLGEEEPRAGDFGEDRLPPAEFRKLCFALQDLPLDLCNDDGALQRLTQIRGLYEPHALALCNFLRLRLPLWREDQKRGDMWRRVNALCRLPEPETETHEHSAALSPLDAYDDEEHGFQHANAHSFSPREGTKGNVPF